MQSNLFCCVSQHVESLCLCWTRHRDPITRLCLHFLPPGEPVAPPKEDGFSHEQHRRQEAERLREERTKTSTTPEQVEGKKEGGDRRGEEEVSSPQHFSLQSCRCWTQQKWWRPWRTAQRWRLCTQSPAEEEQLDWLSTPQTWSC